jgi:hypothetical protein
MSVEENIQAVREYLERKFPGYAIEDRDEAGKGTRCFRISTIGKVHNAVITAAFLETRKASEIGPALDGFTLLEHLRELGATRVIVTVSGLELEES